jgi:hypothetical protein
MIGHNGCPYDDNEGEKNANKKTIR